MCTTSPQAAATVNEPSLLGEVLSSAMFKYPKVNVVFPTSCCDFLGGCGLIDVTTPWNRLSLKMEGKESQTSQKSTPASAPKVKVFKYSASSYRQLTYESEWGGWFVSQFSRCIFTLNETRPSRASSKNCYAKMKEVTCANTRGRYILAESTPKIQQS